MRFTPRYPTSMRIQSCAGARTAAPTAFRARCPRLLPQRVYLEENMSPLRPSQRLGVHENTITNRVRAAQELLPHPIEQRSAELLVALRLIRLTHDA
jgi:PucR-like helix-turn-helix protein